MIYIEHPIAGAIHAAVAATSFRPGNKTSDFDPNSSRLAVCSGYYPSTAFLSIIFAYD